MELDVNAVNTGLRNEVVKGEALLRSADFRKTRKDDTFVVGSLSTSNGDADYKIWSGKLQASIESDPNKYVGSVVNILGKVDEYQGNKSVTIEDAELTGKDPKGYMKSKYNIEDNKAEFLNFMQGNLTEDGAKIFVALIEKVKDTFFTEFASITVHHDNVMGGLTAHSMKCVKVLDAIIPFYPNIQGRVLDKDLVYIGTALHDMGKAIEYKSGSISSVGRLLSHRTLATEVAARMKKSIVTLKGEEWYYRLLAIFEQHHGEFEETPRTVEAYLVHKVDMLESSVTDIEQAVTKDAQKTGFRLHGFNLS